MNSAAGRLVRCRCGLAVALLASSSQAHAETLREAVGRALATNPDLRAERAGQRAREDEIAIARAPGLPQIGATSDYIENIEQTQNAFLLPRRELNATADVSVPLFQGGAIRNRTAAARQRAAAGEDYLEGYQAELLAKIVSSYSNVIREDAVEALNRDNVRALDTNLRAAQARFRAGELTRTDIAQSEARLAFGLAALERAEANSLRSREAYLRVTGLPPSDLTPPTLKADLPDTVNAAEALALDRHPALQSARKEVEASRADVAAARAGGSPRVIGFVGGTYYNYLGSFGSTTGIAVPPRGAGARAGIQLQVPIFQGGLVKAQTRRAQNLRLQAEERRDSIERIVVERVRYAFADVRANERVIVAASAAVTASELSLRGVRAENRVGARSVLDILNAEQELLNSKVQLIAARRDAFVSLFTLLVEAGMASPSVFDDVGNIRWGEATSPRKSDGRVGPLDSKSDVGIAILQFPAAK